MEIIVDNPDREHGPCLLNVDEVGAGTHEVTVISLAGEARVRILDPSGAVVFKSRVEEQAAATGGQGAMEEGQGTATVRLGAGEHRVECILADRSHATDLLVVPARPGH